ncbi:MAG: hypothetical protein AB7R89_01790 [Dehalococcoidia bacterium]
MVFEFWPAAAAGAIGGALMTLMRMLMRAAGIDLKADIPNLWGTMLKVHGPTGRLLGLLIHLVGSAAIGLVYAWAFSLLHIDADLWFWGLLGGAIHWWIAGIFMGVLPAIHPEMPDGQHAPGFFLWRYRGPDVPVFLIGHLMYGAAVGVLYGLFHANGGWGTSF